MPSVVSMHACSVWPVNLDLTVFRLFLAGLSVDEAVDHLLLQEDQTLLASSRPSTPSIPSTGRDSNQCSLIGSASSSHSSTYLRGLNPNTSVEAPQSVKGTMQLTEDKRVKVEDCGAEELPVGVTGVTPMMTMQATSYGFTSSGPSVPAAAAAASASEVTVQIVSNMSALPLCVTRSGSTSTVRVPPKIVLPRGRSHRHHHRNRKVDNEGSIQPKSKGRVTSSDSTTVRNSLGLPSTLLRESHGVMPLSAGLDSFAPSASDALVDSAAPSAGESKDGVRAVRSGNNRAQHLHASLPRRNSAGEAKAISPQRRRGRGGRRTGDLEEPGTFCGQGYIQFQKKLREVEALSGAATGFLSLRRLYLLEEVTEQFQAFRELAREEQLGSPYAFLSNYYVPIPVETRLQLLQMYYQTDSGLFRWAFGDKLSRFDLPSALDVLGERSSLYARQMEGVHGGGNDGERGGADSGGAEGVNGFGGHTGFFWASRWRNSPGKLAKMDAATLARLSEQYTTSLQRQWENIKHVCVTVAALYRGKGDMCVPLDMPLLTTIQQCFGLRQEQALDYATAAFGYEHRLESRLFERLHHYSEYGTICSLVSTLWCDRSGYFLSESFREGCRRIGRMLDEYRILSELHLIIFGETMRPRWQVQLDEVQRVITTSPLVDKNAITSASAAVPVGGPAAVASGISGLPVVPPASPNSTPVIFSGGCASGSASGARGQALGTSASETSIGDPAAGATPSPAGSGPVFGNLHSPFSGNGLYCRRFLMEFPSLMKHLSRVCAALGGNGGINDGLDIFFSRMYASLELLSSRTAPTLVSLLMSAAFSGASAGTNGAGAPTPAHVGVVQPRAPLGTSVSAAAFGRPPLPPNDDRGYSESDLVAAVADGSTAAALRVRMKPSNPPSSCPVEARNTVRRAILPRPTSTGDLPWQRYRKKTAPTDAPALQRAHSAHNFHDGVDDIKRGLNDETNTVASYSFAASNLVNTSLSHPAHVLLPSMASIGAQSVSGINSCTPPQLHPKGNRSTADGDKRVDANSQGRAAGGAAYCQTATDATDKNDSATQLSHVSDLILKGIDKRFLCELCMLLTTLPRAWEQLTTLTREIHSATDKSVEDLTMALKATAQVLMASDDFHQA